MMDTAQSTQEHQKVPSQTAIRRTTLHEEIAGHLRQMIFMGELEDSTRVPEKQLCDRFQISRTPLREALKVLASEGLITLLPNRGARVTKLTPADIDEVFPVMGALEAVAGEMAATHISEEGIAEIRALHYQMALHHTRHERLEYFDLNQKIHKCILEAAGNPTLNQIYNSLSGRIRRARYIANISQDRWDQAMREHEKILDCLTARDGKRLGELLKTHLLNKREAIKSAIQEDLQ